MSTSPDPLATDSAPPPLELAEGVLDEATLRQFFSDLEACVQVHQILVKEHPQVQVRDGGGTLDLATALKRLLARDLRGMQIRYAWQGQEWWDTLLALPTGGYRIVRLQQQFR